MTPIRNEKQEIIGYRQEQPGGQVKIRNKHGELVGWTAFGQTSTTALKRQKIIGPSIR